VTSPKCWRDYCDRISRRPSGLCEQCVAELQAEHTPRPVLEVDPRSTTFDPIAVAQLPPLTESIVAAMSIDPRAMQ
jgi:hypothetical protein